MVCTSKSKIRIFSSSMSHTLTSLTTLIYKKKSYFFMTVTASCLLKN